MGIDAKDFLVVTPVEPLIKQPAHREANRQIRKLAALSGIQHMGTIAAGARACGKTRHTIADWRHDDPVFDEAVFTALEAYRDSLSEEITRRGRDGYEEPVTHQGKLCYRHDAFGNLEYDELGEPIVLTTVKHSDRLLELNAKAFDARYRDMSSLEVVGKDGKELDTGIQVTYVLPPGMIEADYEVLEPLPAVEPEKETVASDTEEFDFLN